MWDAASSETTPDSEDAISNALSFWAKAQEENSAIKAPAIKTNLFI